MVHTPVYDHLGIEHPLLQAAVWVATSRELVAAVSTAGGLGSLGAPGGLVDRAHAPGWKVIE